MRISPEGEFERNVIVPNAGQFNGIELRNSLGIHQGPEEPIEPDDDEVVDSGGHGDRI